MKRIYTKDERAKLQIAFKRGELTINRWIESEDPRLSSETAIKALSLSEYEKNVVYKIANTRLVCIILDEDYAVLCPIIPHKKDKGYSIKLNDPRIYSSKEVIDMPKPAIAVIKNGEYVKLP